VSRKDHKALVSDFYERLWNRWDRVAVSEVLSPEIRFRGSLGIEKRGHEGFIEYVDFIREAFPDFHNTVEEMIADGDRVAARLTYRGTHQGEIFGILPTNRRIQYAGVALFTFENGNISEVWILGDMLAVMSQIGAH
jgi:steroid delta-isomerase-like uncharacterized protein